jgi:hypothetical protein
MTRTFVPATRHHARQTQNQPSYKTNPKIPPIIPKKSLPLPRKTIV